MFRTMMKSKIHRATVTHADLHYVGSVTVDQELMEAADLLEGEHKLLVRGLTEGTVTSFVGFWVNRLNNGPTPASTIWLQVHSDLLYARRLVLENRLVEAAATLASASTAYAAAAGEFLSWKNGMDAAAAKAQGQIALAAAAAILAFVTPGAGAALISEMGGFSAVLGTVAQLARLVGAAAPAVAVAGAK